MPKRKPLSSTTPNRSKTVTRVRSGVRSAKGASTTKTQAYLNLLSRTSGASVAEMQKAIGWQPHSVRSLLSGKIRKMPGVTLTSERPGNGPRRYHVKTA
jgi:hypothetical protein